MSDFVFIRKSRNILSSILHIVFNFILASGSVYLTFLTGNFVVGLILVILSKWRMFAVRPRFLLLNLKSNLVDLIVGFSFILITYCSGTNLLPIHIILALLYIFWLIVLKPKSTDFATNLQSLWAIFFGSIAAVLMSASAGSIFLTFSCFIIGYSATRHVLSQNDDKEYPLLSIIAGIITSEIAWLSHSWLIVYSFTKFGIIIPQLTIILLLLSYLFGFSYKRLIDSENKSSWKEIIMPAVFIMLVISIIIIWFSNPIFNV